nr:MAG TPA: hypothetical protein [Caudoviricetes sp.]
MPVRSAFSLSHIPTTCSRVFQISTGISLRLPPGPSAVPRHPSLIMS